ncbi:hypothetical protein ACLI4A_34265, partial [Pseudomonas aeruginosa]
VGPDIHIATRHRSRLDRIRVPAILGQAGSVGSVDPRDDGRRILQGGQP